MDATKQVVFLLGEEKYGLDILDVNAIESYSGVVPVPNAPNYILGILNLRGETIPVFSLRAKFGMAEQVTESTQLITVRSNGMQVGIKVDAICGIEEFTEKELGEVPAIIRSEKTKYAKSVANKNGEMIILIDANGILNNKEEESLRSVLDDK